MNYKQLAKKLINHYISSADELWAFEFIQEEGQIIFTKEEGRNLSTIEVTLLGEEDEFGAVIDAQLSTNEWPPRLVGAMRFVGTEYEILPAIKKNQQYLRKKSR